MFAVLFQLFMPFFGAFMHIVDIGSDVWALKELNQVFLGISCTCLALCAIVQTSTLIHLSRKKNPHLNDIRRILEEKCKTKVGKVGNVAINI